MAKDHCVASPELKNAKRPRNLQIPLFLPNSPVGTANPGQAFRTCPDLFIELNQSSDQSIRTDCEMVKCLLFPFVFYKKTLPEAQRTQGIDSLTWIIFLTIAKLYPF